MRKSTLFIWIWEIKKWKQYKFLIIEKSNVKKAEFRGFFVWHAFCSIIGQHNESDIL